MKERKEGRTKRGEGTDGGAHKRDAPREKSAKRKEGMNGGTNRRSANRDAPRETREQTYGRTLQTYETRKKASPGDTRFLNFL